MGGGTYPPRRKRSPRGSRARRAAWPVRRPHRHFRPPRERTDRSGRLGVALAPAGLDTLPVSLALGSASTRSRTWASCCRPSGAPSSSPARGREMVSPSPSPLAAPRARHVLGKGGEQLLDLFRRDSRAVVLYPYPHHMLAAYRIPGGSRRLVDGVAAGIRKAGYPVANGTRRDGAAAGSMVRGVRRIRTRMSPVSRSRDWYRVDGARILYAPLCSAPGGDCS